MVTLVDLAIQGIEHKTVRAQLLCCYAVDAFVILVALPAVLVLAVLVRAIERGVCNVANDNTTAVLPQAEIDVAFPVEGGDRTCPTCRRILGSTLFRRSLRNFVLTAHDYAYATRRTRKLTFTI